MPNLNFYFVTDIKLETKTQGGCHWHTLTVTDKDGNTLEITLFNDNSVGDRRWLQAIEPTDEEAA